MKARKPAKSPDGPSSLQKIADLATAEAKRQDRLLDTERQNRASKLRLREIEIKLREIVGTPTPTFPASQLELPTTLNPGTPKAILEEAVALIAKGKKARDQGMCRRALAFIEGRFKEREWKEAPSINEVADAVGGSRSRAYAAYKLFRDTNRHPDAQTWGLGPFKGPRR